MASLEEVELARRLAAMQQTGEPTKKTARKRSGDKHSLFIIVMVSFEIELQSQQQRVDKGKCGNGCLKGGEFSFRGL